MSGCVKNLFSVSVRNIQVLGPAAEGRASSTVRNERNMGMPPHFEELMQGSYASNDEPCSGACSSSDISKDSEDVSLPDSHALLHVTRRKPNTMVIDSDASRFELLAFYNTKCLIKLNFTF
jgi:centromeric protein E